MSLSACAASNGTPDRSQIDPKPSAPQTAPTAAEPAGRVPCTGGIFTSAEDAKIDVPKDPVLMRQRAVRIDFSQLETSPNRLALNLFDDVCLIAIRDRAAPAEAGTDVWSGSIEGVPNSSVTLVTTSGTVIGTVISPPGAYQIRLLRDDVHLVNQVDPSKYPKEKLPG